MLYPPWIGAVFCVASGLGVGVGLAATQLSLVKKANASTEAKGDGSGKIEVKRTVCTHCSVGCAVDAVVQNGVWVRQEPVFDSPINLGAHCAKGAALREHGHGEFRLRYPMKLVNGKYERISWDTALDEISARMLALRKESGPDSLYVVGSSKHNNEQALLAAQVDEFLGQQQLRPPGTYLPLHHCGGCRQYLGVWRDDQLLQRHAKQQVCVVHRFQRCRSTPCELVAHAACQRNRLQDDRGGPALYTYCRQGR